MSRTDDIYKELQDYPELFKVLYPLCEAAAFQLTETCYTNDMPAGPFRASVKVLEASTDPAKRIMALVLKAIWIQKLIVFKVSERSLQALIDADPLFTKKGHVTLRNNSQRAYKGLTAMMDKHTQFMKIIIHQRKRMPGLVCLINDEFIRDLGVIEFGQIEVAFRASGVSCPESLKLEAFQSIGGSQEDLIRYYKTEAIKYINVITPKEQVHKDNGSIEQEININSTSNFSELSAPSQHNPDAQVYVPKRSSFRRMLKPS